MVAYSFNKRFCGPIINGVKRQTIRAHGKRRHARPGEALQLYTGMRTRQCLKIADALCKHVSEIELAISLCGARYCGVITIDNDRMRESDHDRFSQSDGFEDFQDMAAFWFSNHPHEAATLRFQGVLITWQSLALQAKC